MFFVSYNPVLTSLVSSVDFVWNTLSSFPVHAAIASSIGRTISSHSIVCLSFTYPTTASTPLSPAASRISLTFASLSTGISATIFPKPGAKSVSLVTSSSIVTPSLLPNAILETAAASPFPSNAYAETIAPA